LCPKVLATGLQCQLDQLESVLLNPSSKLPQLKQALEVSVLADLSWLVPSAPRDILERMLPLAERYKSAFNPFMLQLPRVREERCRTWISRAAAVI
jgi:hypothetical protein